jgi:hypothetical protein
MARSLLAIYSKLVESVEDNPPEKFGICLSVVVIVCGLFIGGFRLLITGFRGGALILCKMLIIMCQLLDIGH